MRWLTTRRPHGSDRGAAALLIAILLPVFMLIVAGLVVDVGSWYAIRAQSQNGADAAALAIAQSCASGACDTSLASTYSAANSNGNIGSGGATYRLICGSATNAEPSLTPCSDPTIPTNPCPGPPASGADYVNVQTITNNAIGISGGIPGMDTLFDSAKTKVAACAQASWGPAGSYTSVSLIISQCVWNAATSNGTAFAPAPPYSTWPPPGVTGYVGPVPAAGAAKGEQVLTFHKPADPSDCSIATPAGWNIPGGFGWLVDSSGNCAASVTPGDVVSSDPGNSANAACENIFETAATNHTVIYIPVFDASQGKGKVGQYHVAGWAAFVPTGGYMHGDGPKWDHKSAITGNVYCGGSYNMCLYGFFTQGLVPAPPASPGSGLAGVNSVQLTG